MEQVVNFLVDFLVENKETIIELVAILFVIAHAVKQKMSFRQTIALVINTLKDEEKMDGDQFTPETKVKLEEIAKEIGANSKALEEAKRGLDSTHSGTKIGSHKGKPIYLEDVLKKVSLIGGLINSVKR